MSKGPKLLVAVAAVALVAAACSSSTKKTTTNGTTASTAPASSAAPTTSGGSSSGPVRGVTATSITVGCVAQLQAFSGMDAGIKARFERENRAGGVNGRMFKYLPCRDDNSSADTNATLGKELVDKDNVFAVMATGANLLPATTDYFAAQKVPFFGWGFSPGYCGGTTGNQWGFGFGGCLSGIFFPDVKAPVLNGALLEPEIAQVGKPANQTSIFTLSSADDNGKAGLAQYKPLADKLGMKWLGSVDVPVGGTVTDFSPYVSKALAGNPDIIMVSTDFQTAPGATAALKAAGYKGLIYNYVAYIPGLLAASGQEKLAAALEGAYANTQFPPQEGGGDAITQFVSDLKATGDPGFVTQGGSIGYWSADLFVQMVKAVGQNLTPDNFAKVINGGFKSTQPSGGLGALTFPDAHSVPAPCAALVKVVNKAFQVVQPYKCYETFPAK